MYNSVQTVARLFKTLSDPTRLRIIQVLTLDCQSVSAIVEATGFSQPLVSHHLSVLREQDLVRAEPRGGYTFYWLSDKAVWETVERCTRIAKRIETTAQVETHRTGGTRKKMGRRKLVLDVWAKTPSMENIDVSQRS